MVSPSSSWCRGIQTAGSNIHLRPCVLLLLRLLPWLRLTRGWGWGGLRGVWTAWGPHPCVSGTDGAVVDFPMRWRSEFIFLRAFFFLLWLKRMHTVNCTVLEFIEIWLVFPNLKSIFYLLSWFLGDYVSDSYFFFPSGIRWRKEAGHRL